MSMNMKRVSTLALVGRALNWAVHQAEGATSSPIPAYSTDFAAGGPLLAKWIEETERHTEDNFWVATPTHAATGPTLLVAAMRCYVAMKLGMEVEVPEDLLDAADDEQVSPLASFSDNRLIDELTSRGIVVSAWSREDLSFLDDAEWAQDLSDSQLDSVKAKVLEELSRSLSDILGERGNTHLGDWCFNNFELLQKLVAAELAPAPASEEAVQDVVDDILARANKYEFTVGEGNVRELVEESGNLLGIEMPAAQIEDVARRTLEAKEKAMLVEAADNPETRFDYQLLGRLQQDCEYYLGNGHRAKKHLWAGDETEQIAKMKELFAKLPIKPEWITLEKIEQYEAAMVAQPQS